MNLRHDYDQLVRVELAAHGYVAKQEDTDLSRQLTLHDLRAKLIPVRPYRVHFSRELKENPRLIELQGALDELIDHMQRGMPLKPFLSALASRPKNKDYMLMHWGLHHAHLNRLSTLDAKGVVGRADYLIFFRVDRGNIYLIEIVPHKEDYLFEKEELVHIVERNWPYLHGKFPRARGIMKSVEPREIKELRKNNVSMGGVKVGSRIITPGLGTTASGGSVEGHQRAIRIQRDLLRLENSVKLHYTEWFPKTSSWIASIQLIELKDDCYPLRDSSTGHVVEIQRQ